MARTLTKHERLVQIGQTALRDPDGKPYKAVPMYIIVDESAADTVAELSHSEEEPCDDISGLLAAKFKQYMDGMNALERRPI